MNRTPFLKFPTLFAVALATLCVSAGHAGPYPLSDEKEQKALKKSPKAVRALIDRADFSQYRTTDASDKALAYYQKAHKLDRKNPLIIIGMCDAYKSLKRQDEAYRVLNEGIEAMPNEASLYRKRADLRSDFLLDSEALADIDKAIQLRPDAFSYEQRANLLIGQGKFARAMKDIEKVIRSNPKEAKGYAMQGYLYLTMEKYTEAIDSCTRALGLKPGEKLCYVNRALAYEKLGKRKEALADYTHLVRLEPTHAKWRMQKANLEARVGSPQRAIEDYTAAISKSKQPLLARLYEERAQVYERLGNKGKAAADRKTAHAMSKSLYADFLEKPKK